MISLLVPQRVAVGGLRGLGTIGAVLLAAQASAQSALWIEQSGSPQDDSITAAAADGADGVFVGGGTIDPSGGGSFGNFVVWISRFDANGRVLWRRTLDSAATDQLTGAASDGSTGLIACGVTSGDLGGPHAGLGDAWVARYDGEGRSAWVAQFGSVQDDAAMAIANDGAGGAFVAGATSGPLGGPLAGDYDGWIARLDGAGVPSWFRQIGSVDYERVDALSGDGHGGVFVCGSTTGSLGGPNLGDLDVWIARYDATGQALWLRQFGTPQYDQVHGAAPDARGGVFLAGRTEGALGGPGAGDLDAWFARVDADGNVLWTRQLGSPAVDRASACAPDGSGGVIVTGETAGDLGAGQRGGFDAWLARFEADGQLLWVEQVGTAQDDRAQAAAATRAGEAHVGGSTYGALAGPPAGKSDPWLARFDGSCNPGTTYCSASATSIAGCRASLHGVGSPTLSDPSAFRIGSGAVPGGDLGLLLFGASGKDATPYGSLGGTLCVAAPTFRTAPKPGGGAAGQCDGSYAFTLQDLLGASPAVTSGAVIDAQLWARDPANADGFLLSDALEFVVCP